MEFFIPPFVVGGFGQSSGLATGIGVSQTGMGVSQTGLGQTGMGGGMGAGNNASPLGATKFGSSPMFAGICGCPTITNHTCVPPQPKHSLGQDR